MEENNESSRANSREIITKLNLHVADSLYKFQRNLVNKFNQRYSSNFSMFIGMMYLKIRIRHFNGRRPDFGEILEYDKF